MEDKLTRLVTDPKVYIDNAGLIWDATLSQTVAANNANKFYRVQLLVGANSKYFAWTRWGRVGEHGQSACLGDGGLEAAMQQYEKKFKDKSGLKWANRLDTPKNGKYTFLERNYEEDDEEEEPVKKEKTIKEEDDEPAPESALSKGLQNLMSFIFNKQNVLDTLAAMSYDANKLPLGKLGDRTLKSGFSVLKEISELMITPALAHERYGQPYGDALETLSNRYFTLIPHVFGRHRPPTLNTNAQIKKEIDLLEALTDMDVANEIMVSSKEHDDIHPLDRQFQGLGMQEMTEREYKSPNLQYLTKLTSTSGSQIIRVHRTRELLAELPRRDTQHELQGGEHLPHRAPRRKRPLQRLPLRQHPKQRSPPPLARIPQYKLRWYPQPRSSHRTPRSTRQRLHVRQGCIFSGYIKQIRQLLLPLQQPGDGVTSSLRCRARCAHAGA